MVHFRYTGAGYKSPIMMQTQQWIFGEVCRSGCHNNGLDCVLSPKRLLGEICADITEKYFFFKVLKYNYTHVLNQH